MNKAIVTAFLIVVSHSFTFAQTAESTIVEADAQTVSVTEKTPAETLNDKFIACVKSGDAARVESLLDERLRAVIGRESLTVGLTTAQMNEDERTAAHGLLDDALDTAVEHRRPDVVALLLRRGAQPNTEAGEDHPVLMIAVLETWVWSLAPEVRRALHPDSENDLADHTEEDARAAGQAIRAEHMKITRLLLDAGADVNTGASCCGISAFGIAVMCGDESLVRLLLDHRAKLNWTVEDEDEHGNVITRETGILEFMRMMERETEQDFAVGRDEEQAAEEAKVMNGEDEAVLRDWLQSSRAARVKIAELLRAAGARDTFTLEAEFAGKTQP